MLALILGLVLLPIHVLASSKDLERVRKRGEVTCGVQSGFPGFASVDDRRRYSGLEVDVCRAVAAAIFGDGNRVRFIELRDLEEFLASDLIDIASRRLTWSLRREERFGVRFGPVVFYDGQGFLVRADAQLSSAQQIRNHKICVADGGELAGSLLDYFKRTLPELQMTVYADAASAEAAFAHGACHVLSADVSSLAAVKMRLAARIAAKVLPEMISREPLAAVVRAEDDGLLAVMRWAMFAMIVAEEEGVSTAEALRLDARSPALLYARLRVSREAGLGFGLHPRWLRDVLATCGNYGELYERHLGKASPLGLDRGPNALWTQGGLMYAPSLH